jgi:hypothetical protein
LGLLPEYVYRLFRIALVTAFWSVFWAEIDRTVTRDGSVSLAGFQRDAHPRARNNNKNMKKA